MQNEDSHKTVLMVANIQQVYIHGGEKGDDYKRSTPNRSPTMQPAQLFLINGLVKCHCSDSDLRPLALL